MSLRPLKVLVALDEGSDPEPVRRALPAGGALELTEVVVRRDLGHGELLLSGDVVVVACNGSSDRAVEIVADAVVRRPDRPVVVLCASAPNGLLERLFEAGADDILVLPEPADRVGFALEKAVARRQGGGEPGRLIAVIGPKGGTGKTVVATNLGVALAARGLRTTVVDVDLQFGDVALALGVEPRPTISDLRRSGGSLDADKVDGFLLDHPGGTRVLAAPLRPDEAGAIDLEFLVHVLGLLRERADVVVADTGPGFPRDVIATIDAATDVCVVGTLDASSLKDSRLGLDTLALMGYDTGRCRLVLNRAGSRVGIDERDAERVLGRAPDVLVPSDRAVPISVNEGRPVVLGAPRSPAGRALARLASLYADAAAAPPARGRHPIHLTGGRA